MRNLLILLVVLVSMCMDSTAQQASVILENPSNTDLFIRAEAIPSVVRSGRNLDMIFDLTNKRQEKLKNVSFLAYDQCLFSGDNIKFFDDIQPNQTERWSWKWLTVETNFERDCTIKFNVEYSSEFSRTQSVAVLSQVEYNQREAAGTLSSVPLSSSSTQNAINIIISFSETQPFVEGDSITMFIDYVNEETGIIDQLNPEEVSMTLPRNIGNIACNEYDLQNDKLILNRSLKFIGGRAPRSSCTFKAILSGASPIDTDAITLTAMYKYLIDNSLTVKVRP